MELEIERHATVTSTMDVALAAAAAGASEGLVVIAATQTQGRGRRGRTWSSPAGAGLYLSVVFRPPADARATSLLTMAAGVAVRGAIARATGVTAQLKWPNDVVVGRRKLAGILAEGLHLGTAEQAVVVGIGINVTGAAHSPDVADRATSLAACGAAIDAGVLEREVLLALAAAYDALCRGEADDILRAWREAAPSAHGSRVEWDAPDGPRAGITSGVDDSGALLVSTPEAVERIVGGELRWI